jgi:hypothetical protein
VDWGHHFKRFAGRNDWIIASKAPPPGNGMSNIRGDNNH